MDRGCGGPFVVLNEEGVDIYLGRDVWEHHVDESGRLRALVPGYREACFRFEHWEKEWTL